MQTLQDGTVFNLSILPHGGIWGAEYEALYNAVLDKSQQILILKYMGSALLFNKPE